MKGEFLTHDQCGLSKYFKNGFYIKIQSDKHHKMPQIISWKKYVISCHKQPFMRRLSLSQCCFVSSIKGYGFIDNGIHCIDSIQPFFYCLVSHQISSSSFNLLSLSADKFLAPLFLVLILFPLSNISQFLLCLLSIEGENEREQSKTFIQSISLCESLFVHLLQCFDKLPFSLLTFLFDVSQLKISALI